ncbi:MAG: hypothetical protein FWG26_09170 [Betaproteobacteria bacterium]|jgi:hypothetical protein|nr:hypothetical protein [Betaproteobacteria bacterium]
MALPPSETQIDKAGNYCYDNKMDGGDGYHCILCGIYATFAVTKLPAKKLLCKPIYWNSPCWITHEVRHQKPAIQQVDNEDAESPAGNLKNFA